MSEHTVPIVLIPSFVFSCEVCMVVGDLSDLVSLRLPQVEVGDVPPARPKSCKSRRSGPSGWVEGQFLRGPIPLAWLGRASTLGGKALAVGVVLWFLSGLRNRRDDLLLASKTLKRFGVNGSGKSRALKAMEAAGLIRVKPQPGRRNPLVTILDVDEQGK